MLKILKTGVIGSSLKENERRVPIHPDHFEALAPDFRSNLFFERGYGVPFGVSDQEIEAVTGGTASRNELLGQCDIIILAKPMAADLRLIKEGATLWGWAHCVQQAELTQVAIDRKLSLITWEGMNDWNEKGEWLSHTFYRNNEIAGYAGVLHALGLKGVDGEYGPPKKAAVINYGSVSQGAVKALRGTGFSDITVFMPPGVKPRNRIPDGVAVFEMTTDDKGRVMIDGEPFIETLRDMDIIVNGMLQNPDEPLSYISENDTAKLKKNALIIDISCDAGMGFPFARPTSFEEPMLSVDGIAYYAVDHTPSHLWNGASWEISKALTPYLETVMSGPEAWRKNETIRRAVEMENGEVINKQILSFQRREAEYPYKVI